MTTSPPDDWRMPAGFGTWGTDADLVETIKGSITAFANAGSGQVTVTSTGHNVTANMPVRIYGTTNYNGWHVAANVTANTFEITDTWVSTETGTWLTSMSGDSWILFENTTPANDPHLFLENDKMIEVEENQPWRIDGVVYADSITAGDTVSVGVRWYDADKSFVSQSWAHNAELPAIGTWYHLSGIFEVPSPQARFATPAFVKNNSAFHAGLDKLGIRPMPIAAETYMSASQNVSNAGGPYVIQFNSEIADYGSNFNTSTYQFVAPATGLYSVSVPVGVSVATASISSGTFYLRLFKNSGTGVQGYVLYEDFASGIAIGANTWWIRNYATTVSLARGDTLDLQMANSTNTTLTVANTFTYFNIFQVE